jgi:uncharacterized protein with HEPN domain
MSEREWRFYIDDMILFAERVRNYTAGLNQQQFVASGINYDATLRNLELIGEAASHIPQPVRDINQSIPWRLIVATRNRLVHGYLGIDNDTLWSIIRDEVPTLLAALRTVQR